jgi:ribosomal protein S18 acetylase RimI-like enzyme
MNNNNKSIAHMTAVAFVAATSRELSMLPARESWWSWLSAAAIDAVTRATTAIGVGICYLAGSRPISTGHITETPLAGVAEEPAATTETTVTSMPAAAGAEATRPPSKSSEARWDRSLADRKLWILKRSGLFGDDTKGAVIERACSLEDLRKAYRLVHDVYIGTGFILPEPAGMRLRIFETTSETATFVAKVDGRVVGVLSVVGDSPDLGLPSDSAFKPELDLLRNAGMRLCEATNQAVSDEYRKSAVPTELMRCAVAHLTKAGYDDCVATVSPSHNGFYELLGFRELGSERSYSEKLHDPVVALGMDANQYRRPPDGLNDTEQFIHNFLAGGNHFLAHVGGWAKQARRHFLSADLLQQLFVTERNFLAECTPDELRVLERRWGQELFAAVSGDLFIPSMEGLIGEILPPSLARLNATAGATERLSTPDNQTSVRNPESSRLQNSDTPRTPLQPELEHSGLSRN